MEITGNKFAREAFNELGIQKVSGIYDYDSPLIQKYKTELANKVKELLDMEDLKNNIGTKLQPNNSNADNSKAASNKSLENTKNSQAQNEAVNEINKNLNVINVSSQENSTQAQEKQPVKFTDFKIEENPNKANAPKKVEAKISKTSKIKKVDFDFDFDSFNDVNFSNFENDNNTHSNSNGNKHTIKDEDKDDPFSSFDDKNENSNAYTSDYLNSNINNKNNFANNEKIRQEADKKFATKKAVSYEDYAKLYLECY